MSSRPTKVGNLKEDLPPTISPAERPQTVRRTHCIHTGKGRNLVVNLEGTSNQLSGHSTNVVELLSRLIKDTDQVVYYDSGIGTYAPPSFTSLSYLKQVIYHAIDMAIAWNFENIIYAAYTWLYENYEPGDRIFLFGFSRGANQARVIAGMIEKVGLLHKGNSRQLSFAYELYASFTQSTQRTQTGYGAAGDMDVGNIDRAEASRTEQDELCRQFKRSFCHEGVKVHFIGAWDTVSSIGVLRGKSLPETVSGMGHVCAFRHALALDECRVKFQPEFANGGLGPRDGDVGDVKEVWFAGSHSDIGGGNTLNEYLKNFGPALRWMTYEAIMYGLRIKAYDGAWEPPHLTDSLWGFWHLFELLPFPSLSYADEHSLTSAPHSGAGRTIHGGQHIHQSVLSQKPLLVYNVIEDPLLVSNLIQPIPGAFSTNEPTIIEIKVPYCPQATLGTTLLHENWEALIADHNIIEQDFFENAFHALTSLADACLSFEISDGDINGFNEALNTLQSFLSNEACLAALVEVPSSGGTLLTALGVAVHHQSAVVIPVELKETLIRLLSQARLVPTTARLPPVSQVYQWGSDIRRYREDFVKALQPLAFLGHQQGYNYIMDMAFSPLNHQQIVFTSSPGETTSVLIWDGSTQNAKEITNVQGEHSIISRDASHIAVTGGIGVSIINTTTQLPLAIKYTDNDDPNVSNKIGPLCFAHDNQTLASGHDNGWVKLWQRKADQWELSKSLKGGDSRINYLAFSKDGSRLVFAVDLGPIKVWSLADQVLSDLDDSQENSVSLVWNPSGNWIVSGTVHGSVNVWSPSQGVMEHTFQAHESTIRCLAFRGDGQVLATGSMDGSVKIWKCDTWANIWEFDIGDWVASIVFSHNGKQLASGGYHGGIHLWDVDTKDDKPVD